MEHYQIILTAILLRIPQYMSQDSTFIVTEKYCITNSTSAIIFNPSIEKINENENTPSKYFLPGKDKKPADQNYDCAIEEGETCTKNHYASKTWKFQNSIDGKIGKVITDRRWEEFKTYKSQFLRKNDKDLAFTKVSIEIHDKNFTIPFSVRLKQEGHMFLCEGKVSESNCYWLMLQAWKGKKSAIRRCEKGHISMENEKWPGHPCNITRASLIHTNDIITDEFWNHFKITMEDGVISVTQGKETLLEFKDDRSFSPKYIFIHSKFSEGLWKFHHYTYLYADTLDASQLGPTFEVQKGLKCIAFFVVTCDECVLVIEAVPEITSSRKITTPDKKWTEIKFYFNKHIDKKTFGIFATTEFINGKQANGFWAIDSVRQCEDKEYRILKSSTDSAPCQLLADKDTTLTTRNKISDNEINCSEDTFGKDCVPCRSVGNYVCSSFKYCELVEKAEFCHCTAGFYGSSCNRRCIMKHYGHGCKQQCTNCANGCNSFNGFCDQSKCVEGFKGAKCDDPVAPLLKYPPKVTDIYPTSFRVHLDNYEVIGDRDKVNYFQLQYKKISDSTWQSGDEQPIGSLRYLNEDIDNLEADTTYCVRVVLYADRSDIYTGSAVKDICNNTTCVPYTSNDIEIDTYNTSATVKLGKSQESCQIGNYQYSLDSGEMCDMKEEKELPNLTPFKRYTFKLWDVRYGSYISKQFQTEEGVPSEVLNLKKTYSTSDRISIQWEAPRELNGNVRYIVQYKKLRNIDCNTTEGDHKLGKGTRNTYVTIRVDPYSVYEIKVAARTNKATGEYTSTEAKTNSSGTWATNELPKISLQSTSTDTATLSLIPPSCKYIQGPIYLKFASKCQSDGIHLRYFTNISTYPIKGCQPYSLYTLTVSASRDFIDWSKRVKTLPFLTEPTVPNKIKEIYVTSKDEHSVSLRWKPPFPETGILARYRIQYNEEKMELNITECSLWKGYHCATIKNLKTNSEYKIDLYATNVDPNEYVSILERYLTVITETAEPEAPYNVTTAWTKDNDLKVSWTHPNKTNGKVTNFTVNFNDQSFPLEIKSIKDYNLTYSQLIAKQNFDKHCTKYDISVTINNKKFDKKSSSTYVWSPPPTPIISNSTIEILNGTNHTVKIGISKLEGNEENVNNCNKTFFILTSSSTDKKSIEDDITNFENGLKYNNDAKNLKNVQYTHHFQTELPFNENIRTESPGVKVYRLYVYFVNRCYGKVEWTRTERNPYSEPDDSNNGIYALILLVLLVPLIIYLYIYKIKKKQDTNGSLISVIKPKRKRDTDEVPLSENAPAKATAMVKPPTPQKPIMHRQSAHVIKTKYSKPIKIIDFEQYVKRAIATGELEKQHENFPRGQTKPWEYGSLKVNKSKNRYNNLVAYDHTRVKLAKIDGNEYSDYINANYIDGYRMPRAYIATQGPKSTTLNDFWRMIWQEKVKDIVMLANIYEGGKKKVDKYWPSINEETEFNGIRVQYVSSKVYANYEHRVFKVFHKTQHREVNQLHFTTWPDHGVPLYSQSLVPFLQQMLKIPNNSQCPVVVHCSAGVGRTGTIILCDISLRMAAGEGSIDFLANLEHLRSQRPNMVDNVEQYKLAHLVVLECLFGMHTSIPCDENINKAIQKVLSGDSIANQMRYLIDTEWEDKAMDTIWTKEDMVVYPEKNRFQEIVPDKNHQICLRYYPVDDESTCYINAVQVDGFRSPERFIVTQQPLPNTVSDFWRMVWERQCTVIVSLNEIDKKDETCCRFWPKKGTEISPVDYLRVSNVSTKALESYQIITLEMINKKENESMQVNVIAMRNWKRNEMLPPSIEDFMLFWEECDILSRKSDTVVVTCYDGARASGFYIASTFLIDKIKLEQECDVCLAVRTIRHNRKEFVTSEEQFSFLYKVALMYVEGFESYANFS